MKITLFIGLLTIGVARSQLPQCPPTGIHSIAYPGFCSRFIRCIGGNPTVQVCAPGLAFDAVFGGCNAEAAANCNPCKDNPANKLRFNRDSQDCSRFSMCLGTVLSEGRCSTGLYFSLVSNTCEFAANVDCPASGTTNPPDATTPTPTTPPPGAPPEDEDYGLGIEALCNPLSFFEMLASPFSCERHIICACGQEVEARNCPTGLIFDISTQSCNTREQGRCLSESAPPCPPNVVDLIAHPLDCRYMVLCINGSPVLEACAPGLEANRQTNKCDFPHIAQCSSQGSLTYAELMNGMKYL